MNKKFLLVATLLACAYPFVSHADAAVDEVQQVQALQAENSRTIHVETAGTLSTLITADEIKQLSELKVTGEINEKDFDLVRAALTYQKFLISLDFSEATYQGKSFSVEQCEGIVDIKLPKGAYILKNMALGRCYNLTNITIPEGVTAMNYGAFYECSNLTTITIPESVTTIGDYAFYNCSKLINIAIPESVTTIGNSAFAGCSTLELLEFKSNTPPQIGTEVIPYNTIIVVPQESYDNYKNHPDFQQYINLGHIVCDKSLLCQTHNVQALYNSSALLNAMGEECMKNVFDLTVKGSINGYDIMMIRNKMPNLKYLDLTDAEIVANPYEYYEGCHTEDHRLGRSSFEGMTSLVSVKLPKTITAIDPRAFYGCIRLKNVVIQPGVVVIDREVFEKCSLLESIDIPSTVKTLGNNCFYECSGLSKVSLNEGLLSIGEAAFLANSFEDLSIPTTVESIGNWAFSRCSRMTEIILPPRLKAIATYAFYLCSALEKLHIPPMVERIEDAAFRDCNNLKDIYVYVANPKDLPISQKAFTCWSTATLHVPSFGYADYYMNTQWGQFAHLEKFDEPYETFYTKNTLTLDSNTGIIDGTPDALFYEHGSLEVNDNEVQPLDEVTLVHDGKDGASLIPEQTGNITVETLGIDINVRANSWHFFSFPFDIDLASIKYDGDYVWRQYDGAKRSRREGGWQNLAAGTTVLKAGRGYIFQGTTAGVLHLEVSHPEITADNVNTELKTYATADTDPADASWNFIGNPYTSYYAVDEATYAAPITIWTGNGYEAYRPGDDDYEFAPYEAFFVQTPTGTNALNFNADNREGYEEMQAAQSQRRMARAQKKVNPNRLLVNLELGVQGDPSTGSGTSEYLDKTRVVFNDECSLDYESDCDAAKFFSDERRAELYTIGTDGTQYAINERPEDGGYVDLGFVANQKGKYTISAQRMDVPMLLVDDVMETTFDLRNGAYEFSSAKGTFNKRFSLKRYESITTSIKDLTDQIGMTFSISDGSISVDGLDASTRVSLYNTAGQQIATQQGNGTMAAIPGTYVISVGKLTAKVIVK